VRALVVVTRAPGAAAAKTRLAQDVGAQACERLQRAFLDDTVAWAGELAPRRVLSVHPPDSARELAGHAPGWVIAPQTEEGFGERMRGAVNAGFAAGGSPVAMIATDSPTLPAAVLEEGWALVERDADVALAPAEDGGWVMVAARAPLPASAFAGVRWSAPGTLADTESALARAGLRTARTTGWYDVDTGADLDRLRAELAAGADARLPCTAGALMDRSAGRRYG
jgi:uncharacterized protein